MTNPASQLELSNKHFNIFDSTPLNGLRGFVSLHILLFHSIQDVTLINIYGDVNIKSFYYSLYSLLDEPTLEYLKSCIYNNTSNNK